MLSDTNVTARQTGRTANRAAVAAFFNKFSLLWSTHPTTHNRKHEDPWETVRDHNKFKIVSPESLEYKLAPCLSIYCLSLGVWDEFESWLLNIRGNCPVKYSII